MIGARKNAECHLSLGVASGALFAGYAQIAASTMVDAYSSAVPGRLIAACATIGAVRNRPTVGRASIGARSSAATADRMLTAALARVAHDPSRIAVFPCHP